MEIETLNIKDYEVVKRARDKNSGLDAIIAVHSTMLGPAFGGMRMRQYFSDEGMLEDALRLSRSMTYKCAAAGIDAGGCKCIINGDPKTQKTPELLESMAEFVQSFNGQVYTGKDMNIYKEDLATMKKHCDYIVEGILTEDGDPSYATALGIYNGIKSCVGFVNGSRSLSDLSVLVQGIGDVGKTLASMLYPNVRQLLVTDKESEKLDKFKENHDNALIISPDVLLERGEFDIFSPCAVGDVITENTVRLLKERSCRIIAGSANNQLISDIVGYSLYYLKMIYAPDFIINAGGLLDVTAKMRKITKQQLENELAEDIPARVTKILYTSEKTETPTNIIASRMAKERLVL